MPGDLAGLRRDRTKASNRMTELATAARGRSMTDDEQRDFDAAATQVRDLDAQISPLEAEGPRSDTSAIGRAQAAEIARLCADGGVPSMTASLLAEGASVDDAKKRIASAGEAQNLVALARQKNASIPEDLATTMLAEGKSVENVRAALFDKLVATEESTVLFTQKSAGGTAGSGASKPVDLVADMKRRHGVKA